MELESMISDSNNFYNEVKKAYILKRTTPIKVLKTKNGRIVDGFFEKQSTLDFNGVYKQRYLEFETKSTKSMNSFPLENIPNHQIEHIKRLIFQKAICFLIVEFSYYNKYFLLNSEVLQRYLENSTKKSIPYSYFISNCKEIKIKYRPRLDYLSVVDEEFFL